MENIVSVLIIAFIAAASKRNEIPLTLLFFYLSYMTVEICLYGTEVSEFCWYLINCSIDLTVLMVSFLTMVYGVSYVRTTFIFMLYILSFYLIPDSLMLATSQVSDTITFGYFYNFVMSYAVYIDVLFALIGSDNKISRMIFGEE